MSVSWPDAPPSAPPAPSGAASAGDGAERRRAGISLLGVRIHPLTLAELNALVEGAVAARERTVIAGHNLQSVYLHGRDEELRAFYRRARWVRVDGMPLIALSRGLGHRVGAEHRVTWVDWLHPLLARAAEKGWRVFYLGSRPGVAAAGAERLRAAHPGLRMETEHGYFGEAENEAVLARIAAFRPDVLLVGMGRPRQERWIHRSLDRLDVPVVLPCGACMDYVAGAIPTPPRWLGRLGLEWAYRLATEPGRLWRRYLVEPWALLPLYLRDLRAARRRGPRGEEASG